MSVSSVWKMTLAMLFVVAPFGGTLTVEAQPYTAEEYQDYQTAIGVEGDGKADAIIAFMKANEGSSLVSYAVNSYIQMLDEHQKQGQHQKVVAAGEQLLAVKPDDFNTLYLCTVSAYHTQQFQKVVGHGEKVYAQKPSSGLAFVLANSYTQLKNDEKIVEYGEIASAEIAPKDFYQILGELMRIYAGRADWTGAAKWATKTIKALDATERPAATAEAEWEKYVGGQKSLAHAVLGRQAAEGKRWGPAIDSYQQVLGLQPSPASRGEAYYYIGRGRWEQKQLDPAMQAFARGSVQRGAPHAKSCREYLETLYKSTHNDSLAGIEEFVERTLQSR